MHICIQESQWGLFTGYEFTIFVSCSFGAVMFSYRCIKLLKKIKTCCFCLIILYTKDVFMSVIGFNDMKQYQFDKSQALSLGGSDSY